ncbi:predicted protein [Phaeodactylum tricornutum CCAP 1055/1]|uniref:Uncharacterized protein n=1 Tax=Phaeodactylum tricornutum (strain CCAP 1055/1) TaxID=556484 RepID=B7GAP5_PHATC|nr:predicted protein [Phaeodactylum tricornutum CCAP 1055/1]EEC44291.1 predicted protein [Phaeodactylum tricornutum CCAP 1055/1]|eukprot:XP_002184113.1 predicted protein [Phaeodactylum tricornutum CCAP 1055/1]
MAKVRPPHTNRLRMMLRNMPRKEMSAAFIASTLLLLIFMMSSGTETDMSFKDASLRSLKAISTTTTIPSTCNAALSSDFASSSMVPKVSNDNARRLAQGGYTLIAQGSGPVELVGLFSMALSEIQHSSNIFGSVGELGVHHGRFTSCLFITARENEKLVIADIFEQQNKNEDKSGNGDKAKFMEGLAVYGLEEKDLHTVFTGSTLEIPMNWSQKRNFEPFRLVSVDAGHTELLTKNDITIASCNLLIGGIIVLDDVLHPHWLGVTEGIFNYFHEMKGNSRQQLYPFLLCNGKLFLTNDLASHGKYYNSLKNNPVVNMFLATDATMWGGSSMFLMNEAEFLFCHSPESFNAHDVWASLVY